MRHTPHERQTLSEELCSSLAAIAINQCHGDQPTTGVAGATVFLPFPLAM